MRLTVESCLSEHMLNTKWTHFSHKIKVIAIVYWESVNRIDDFQPWMNIARSLMIPGHPA